MAKSSKKKKSQLVSVDSIYEMLKEKKFTEDLWLDLLADLKEKPTFKKIKEMVASVFTEKLKGYEQKPVNSAERSQRRAELAEISILAYTIDRVLSEVLEKRLHNELKTFIADMLKEFQNNPSKTKPVENKPSFEIHAMLENIESIFTEKSANGKGKVAKNPESSINELMAQNFGRKRGRPRKNISTVKEGEDSDSNISIESISSVKTDDLSSFDDNVSVDTVENIGRKKIVRRKKIVPLQKANTMMAEGKISKIYQVQKIAEQIKKASQNQKIPVKILPQRKRKPNSKYNTETMFCNVKDYASDRSTSSDTTDHTANIPSQTNQKAKKRKFDSLEKKEEPAIVEMKKETDKVEIKKTGSVLTKKTDKRKMKKIPPPNIVSTRSANISSSSDKSSSSEASEFASPTKMHITTQRYDTADLYKPRFHFGKS